MMDSDSQGRRPLIVGIDHIEWDAEPINRLAGSIEAANPYCIRAANFFTRTIDLLNALTEPRVVLWKMEFWGTDTPYEQVPRSENIEPDTYVQMILATGHRIIPYTFNSWGRERLRQAAPTLREHTVELLPIAQKVPVVGQAEGSLLRSIGLDPAKPLAGCGGLLHPAKGIEKIVESFLSSFPDPQAHLLCSLIIEDDEESAQDVLQRWTRQYGDHAKRRVHIRTGPYGDWGWMCEFYRSIDVMLVNSVSDSWGRMAAEPMGLGVPTIVRRADCGTNHIAPNMTLVDAFEDMDAAAFTTAIKQAQASAPQLSDYVNSHYAPHLVRDKFIDVLSRHMPETARDEFMTQAAQFGTDLDKFIVY